MLNGSADQGVQLATARNCSCVWVAEVNEVHDCKVVSRLGIVHVWGARGAKPTCLKATRPVRATINAFRMRDRNWSVFAVWITGEPKHEYAKVRADEGVIGLGRGVSVQRTKETVWRSARVVEAPDSNGLGSLVWLTLALPVGTPNPLQKSKCDTRNIHTLNSKMSKWQSVWTFLRMSSRPLCSESDDSSIAQIMWCFEHPPSR